MNKQTSRADKLKFLSGVRGWKSMRKAAEEEKMEWALSCSVNSALFRAFVYSRESGREEFKEDWKRAMRRAAAVYRKGASEIAHVKKIQAIAAAMSQKHGRVLKKKQLRIGVAQKAFNLYLKYLWCMEMIPAPPHCPLDAVALKKARIYEAWTKLNDAATYREWIARCREAAGKKSLTEWELKTWNAARGL